jgi:hypothetical protein
MEEAEEEPMPIVLLEGCDKSGKSTIAERIKACWETRYGRAEIIHKGPIPPNKDPMQEYWSELPRPEIHELYILDRWHVGELVYGPIYRGKSKITFGDALRIQAAMERRGLVAIHMTADPAVIRQRFIEDGEDFAKLEDIPRILDGFNQAVTAIRKSSGVFPGFWVFRSDQHIGPPMVQHIVESAAIRGLKAEVKHA